MTRNTQPAPNFKLPTRVSPNVHFAQNLMRGGKPAQNLLFGMLADENACTVDGVTPAQPEVAQIVKPKAEYVASASATHWPAMVIAFLVLVIPAVSSFTQELLQDTLKSGIAALMILGCAVLVFWTERHRSEPLRWHPILWLPITMLIYAAVSMIWAHTYLAAVESVRWFLFALLLWLTLNAFNLQRAHALMWGIHLGAFGVAIWGGAQFWFDLGWINQGPNPASTFANRNFAAEYMVMTVPLSLYLTLMTRNVWAALFLILTASLNLVYLMQTGTRSALAALLLILPLLCLVAFVWRKDLACAFWQRKWKIGLTCAFAASLLALGTAPTGNPKIAAEAYGTSAFERAVGRTQSIRASDTSLKSRLDMWKQVSELMQAHPLVGVGAGNWEAESPKWFAAGQYVEIDYYVHNEFLQVIAEYGVVGWIFIFFLFTYLLIAAWRTIFIPPASNTQAESTLGTNALWGNTSWMESVENAAFVNVNSSARFLRCVLLASLLALLIVSLAGFAWRLAATGVLFAICLGLIAALEPSTTNLKLVRIMNMPWKPKYALRAAVLSSACMALAGYIFYQAILAERYIIRSIVLSMQINQDRRLKQEQLPVLKERAWALAKEGIAINPHYRKLTSLIAEEMSKWGDWSKAAWILDSVIESRPYVPALLTNAALAQVSLNDMPRALNLIERALKLQPVYPDAQAIQLFALWSTKKLDVALPLAKKYLNQGAFNSGGLDAVYKIAFDKNDFQMAERATQLLIDQFPQSRIEGLLRLAKIHHIGFKNETKALEIYRGAMRESQNNAAVLASIPEDLRRKL